MNASFTISPPTAVPCPDFCDEEQGHPYELLDVADSAMRVHGRRFGAGHVFADANVLATYRAGVEAFTPLTVTAWLGGNAVVYELSPDVAIELGRRLVEAGEWANSQDTPA